MDGAGHSFTYCNFVPSSAQDGWKSGLNDLLRVLWAKGHVLNISVLLFTPSRMAHRLWVLKLDLRQLWDTNQLCVLCEESPVCFTRRWSSLHSVWLEPAFFLFSPQYFKRCFYSSVCAYKRVPFSYDGLHFSIMPMNCLRKLNNMKNH